ncbi:nitroreductase family protein [Nocardiopsis tropica]|uniref:nitroreductase family protein n=1 Tax=Nocardiopsis tropica TaxID=109330 RepID=UPI00361919DE
MSKDGRAPAWSTTGALHGRFTSMSTITEIIRSRRSPRVFVPDPVPGGVIREVLEDAHWAPSRSNTQPWTTHIVSGSARDALSSALLETFTAPHCRDVRGPRHR